MSRLIDDGGPAFPVNETRFPNGMLNQKSEYGMELRDYFAAKAMAAHITANWGIFNKVCTNNVDGVNPLLAKVAYEAADAMLKARTK